MLLILLKMIKSCFDKYLNFKYEKKNKVSPPKCVLLKKILFSFMPDSFEEVKRPIKSLDPEKAVQEKDIPIF